MEDLINRTGVQDPDMKDSILDFLREHQKDFVGKRVFLAEGSAANRGIVREILEKQGFIVDAASDAEAVKAGIDSIVEGGCTYFAVLLDPQMAKVNPAGLRIPVIALDKPIDIPLMLAALAKSV